MKIVKLYKEIKSYDNEIIEKGIPVQLPENFKYEYAIICNPKNKLYMKLVDKGIKNFNSCIYDYYRTEIIDYLKNYAKSFNRNYYKTDEWSKTSPWWKLKSIFDKFNVYEDDYKILLSEEENQNLIDIIPTNTHLKLWLKSTTDFKNNLKNDVLTKEKGLIPITTMKYNAVDGYSWLSNQYLTIRFIKKEDILEEIEISEEKELFPYQEKLITLKEVKYVNPKEVSQRKEIKFFLDDVLIKTYQENFNEIDFFNFLKSLDLDISDCRFRTNTKFDKKYMENIKSTILVKNLHTKINKINSEIEEDMSFF